MVEWRLSHEIWLTSHQSGIYISIGLGKETSLRNMGESDFKFYFFCKVLCLGIVFTVCKCQCLVYYTKLT